MNGSRKIAFLLAAALVVSSTNPSIGIAKEPNPSASAIREHNPRLFVLTDIGGDPDDKMSLVRLLTYANQIDIEGLVATHNSKGVFPEEIEHVVDAYGKVRDNLEKHETGFPTGAQLRERIFTGSVEAGETAFGKGKESAGSNALIRAVDRADARPLWVTVWGGPTTLAQALWTVQQTRSKSELAKFVAKLRVHAISDQDTSGPWIRKNFPDLFYIVSPGSTFHFSTWIGIGGDYFHGRFAGGDWSLVTNEWLDRNIRAKGPLGEAYPRWKFMMEGDTPSYLNLIDNGLSEPERPDWGGWGGRYELYTPPMRSGSLSLRRARSGPMPATRSWVTMDAGTPINMQRSGVGGKRTRTTLLLGWIGQSKRIRKPTIPRFQCWRRRLTSRHILVIAWS